MEGEGMRRSVRMHSFYTSVSEIPSMELLALLCGGEEMRAEVWEEFGKALGISEERLERISIEEGTNLEKCKQCVMNVSQDLTPSLSNFPILPLIPILQFLSLLPPFFPFFPFL